MNSTPLKLYVFDCGRGHVADGSMLTPGLNVGKPLAIPFAVYLIEHPMGLVIFDTGLDAYREDMKTRKGPGRDEMLPEQRIDRQLMKLGYKPEDIKIVILSHMDSDHAGCMALFPQSTFIVRKRELEAAWWPERPGGRNFNDYKDTRKFNYIQPLDDEQFDVFYDGSLICIDTKGHSPGHQSLIVNLPQSGKFVLVGDVVYTEEMLDKKIMSSVSGTREDAFKSLEKLRYLRNIGMRIIIGHDLAQFNTLKKAPDYYE